MSAVFVQSAKKLFQKDCCRHTNSLFSLPPKTFSLAQVIADNQLMPVRTDK